MKLREILNAEVHTGYPDSHRYHFPTDLMGIPAFEGLIFKEYLPDDETHYLGLFKEDKLVSYLQLDVRETEYFQVTYSATDNEYKRKGCFRYLLNKAVERHRTILSDDSHTPDAKAAWKSLIERTSGIFDIYVYDIITGEKYPTYRVDPDKIWNDKREPVLMITNTAYTEAYLKSARREHKGLIECNRHYDGLWYGTGTSGDDYDNP